MAATWTISFRFLQIGGIPSISLQLSGFYPPLCNDRNSRRGTSLRWLTTATTCSSWPRCARRIYHRCHRLRAETIQAMCAQGHGGPIISRTGFSKTSPTFSLLQSQPSTTVPWDKAMCRHRGSMLYFPTQKSHRWHHWPNTYAPSLSPQYCPRCWSRLSCPGWDEQQCTVKLSTAASKTAPPPLHSSRCYTMCSNVWRERTHVYARILLIDFSKAFDHIDHNILLDKLKTNGVPQICVEWQKAFLTSRTQRVKRANTKSDWIEVVGGVPQGTLSGSENFLNMIDDPNTDIDDVKFVDDVTLYEVCNTHSQNKLQNAVDDIQELATDNNMSLNTNKTKELLVYFVSEDLDIPRITINGDVIERVSCAKLLGCHIMSNLSWEDHIANLLSEASRRLHLLRELKRAGLSSKDLLTRYFSFVRSTTEYACQVW